MSTNGKVKMYKNPARNKPDNHKPYVPQYQLLGVEPEEYKSPLSPGYQVDVSKGSKDNPRAPRSMIRQPYAEAVDSPIGRGRGPLPNVGNNVERTWSSVDGEIVDDISVDPNHPMVDNNDYVSESAFGLPPEMLERAEEVETIGPTSVHDRSFVSGNQLQDALNSEHLSSIIHDLDEDTYLLMVEGQTVCSGPSDYIEEQTRLLVFGEHPSYDGPVSVDDIVIIKRVKIKVGVFLE